MNSNCGGRNHGATNIEISCIDWLCQKAGFTMNTAPTSSENFVTTPFGVLTGGTSQATIYALLSARTKKFGYEIRKTGIQGTARVHVYVSDSAHSCISRAMECIGYGSDSVVRIPTDSKTGSIQVDKLREHLEKDNVAGIEPLAIVGTAGSVTIGAYDNFAALADLAEQYST